MEWLLQAKLLKERAELDLMVELISIGLFKVFLASFLVFLEH
jgi:hypothetical protein